ncbi:hypothetical protein [Butyrivibrio sp. INlla16]|uniref:hypothetical protein n=1 Tax=Butyrivibrio sp. INlla16 TaxID=1520807 RepID=UPI00088A2BB6|nr:hypothetical protein [Butyrivibrio sp. INlla16]SDB07292.1 hypothetical protein SAMN02910263_00289 [Butyrivibrio sp. INlla16]
MAVELGEVQMQFAELIWEKEPVEETFGGLLPAFLAAFTSRQKLSKKEIDEIKKIIDDAKG